MGSGSGRISKAVTINWNAVSFHSFFRGFHKEGFVLLGQLQLRVR